MSKRFINVVIYFCLVSFLGTAAIEAQHISSQADTAHGWSDVPDETNTLQKHSLTDVIVKRSTTHIVDIAMFDDSSAPGKQFSVYVDKTMTRLIIQAKVDRSNPVMIVTKPSGLPGPRPSLNTTTDTGTNIATIDTAITAADYGIWKIMKMDASTWNVNIQGESPLDFTYQFLAGTFIQILVTGDPIQGVKLYENTRLDINFSVVNKLSTDQDIDVRIEDTQGLAEAPVFMSPTLKPSEKFTGKFVIRDGMAGVKTTVTITARQYLGFGKGFSLGPSEVRQFTVQRNDTRSAVTRTSSNTFITTATKHLVPAYSGNSPTSKITATKNPAVTANSVTASITSTKSPTNLSTLKHPFNIIFNIHLC